MHSYRLDKQVPADVIGLLTNRAEAIMYYIVRIMYVYTSLIYDDDVYRVRYVIPRELTYVEPATSAASTAAEEYSENNGIQ